MNDGGLGINAKFGYFKRMRKVIQVTENVGKPPKEKRYREVSEEKNAKKKMKNGQTVPKTTYKNVIIKRKM